MTRPAVEYIIIGAICFLIALCLFTAVGCATVQNTCLPDAIQVCEKIPGHVWHRVVSVPYQDNGYQYVHAMCLFYNPETGTVYAWDMKGSHNTWRLTVDDPYSIGQEALRIKGYVKGPVIFQ